MLTLTERNGEQVTAKGVVSVSSEGAVSGFRFSEQMRPVPSSQLRLKFLSIKNPTGGTFNSLRIHMYFK